MLAGTLLLSLWLLPHTGYGATVMCVRADPRFDVLPVSLPAEGEVHGLVHAPRCGLQSVHVHQAEWLRVPEHETVQLNFVQVAMVDR